MYIFILISAVISTVSAVISLQLPGLTYATGTPTTIDVDFLDKDANPLYHLKGEVFVKTLPTQANSIFLPDKLTGGPKYVGKIRIKAGESGMILKLFDSTTATVPKLMVMIKENFYSSTSTIPPIEIDFLDDSKANILKVDKDRFYNYYWYGQDVNEITRMGGMHVAKLEIHVERKEELSMLPVKSFGVVSFQSNDVLMPEELNKVIVGSSVIPSQNAVYMPVGRPCGSEFFQRDPRYPNAVPYTN